MWQLQQPSVAVKGCLHQNTCGDSIPCSYMAGSGTSELRGVLFQVSTDVTGLCLRLEAKQGTSELSSFDFFFFFFLQTEVAYTSELSAVLFY